MPRLASISSARSIQLFGGQSRQSRAEKADHAGTAAAKQSASQAKPPRGPRDGSKEDQTSRKSAQNNSQKPVFAVDPVPSIRLNYPKNRLLLGTTANIETRGVQKALDTAYPLEISLRCLELPARPTFFSRMRRSSSAGTPSDDDPMSATPASLSAEIHPFAIVYFRSPVDGRWELIGRTETVMYDESLRFITKLKLSCATVADRLKEIRVIVYDRRDPGDDLRLQRYLGVAECRLEDIVSDPLLRLTTPLRSAGHNGEQTTSSAYNGLPTSSQNAPMSLGSHMFGSVLGPTSGAHARGRPAAPIVGRIQISADVIKPVADDLPVIFDVDVSSSTKGATRLFYVLSRQLRSGDYTAVHRSEILGRNKKRFAPVTRSLGALTAGVESKLLRMELYQFRDGGGTICHTKLGYMQTSVAKLRTSMANARQLWWPSANSTEGIIEIERVVLTEKSSSESGLHFKFRFTH
jgi:hypothetical protein